MERIVDFRQADTGMGVLTRLVPKVDPGVEDSLQWDLDLTFEVDDGAAAHVEGLVPAGAEYLGRALDGQGSATVTVQPAARDVYIVLTDDAGAEYVQAAAEVRFVKLRVTERAQSYVARLRLFALHPNQSTSLTAALGKRVAVTVEPAQQSLDLMTRPAEGDVVTGSSGGDEVCGTYRRLADGREVLDDFGVVYPLEHVVSFMPVDIEDGALTAYEDAAKAAGLMPRWADLIVALAHAFAAGEPVKQGRRWVLTRTTAAGAVTEHEQAAAQ